ncbi:MAG: NAD(P)-dependent oxidoreductase [Candidatus Paceibacterota bacterium]|jgi:nucleoside-diphosphate-sugar epimerase
MSEAYDIQFMQNNIYNWFHHTQVLITGCEGFFGSWMYKALLGKCTLFFANHNNLSLHLEELDKLDYIFHFAPTPIEPVIECAKRSNAKILYASSGGVYGGARVKVDEDYPANPITDYAHEKLRSENILRKSGLDYCIARLFTFSGKGMKNTFAITAFVDAVKNNKPLVVMSQSVRTYMYIADAIVWLCKLMQSENGTYNVGSEREIRIDQLAMRIASYVIPPADILKSDKPFVDNAPYYVPDCSKARDLGLENHFTLEYAIRQMLEYKSKCDSCEFFGDIDRTNCMECEEK